ncbi:PREDICTED: PERQ amino acid-rich with GYF domain-containing protein CG11148 isoform X2 [Rhagoletis zephyria]|uniref:PERQ amino acid-rich with GYF domain-containing protein CG11148 isoform X2 n=1 Tax=Rhagoletis zephyria TaxID=28612 RepID=UPI0008117EC2|nr:PREDICTED: PERQ amino acid-rich with GYF domain-containing protein CG11148 isoform X2 [Rhagoletis zephyria]
MTDSMKFGPEWLRNLSTDNTSLLSSGGGNSGGGTSLSNSGSIVGASSASNNGGNGGGQHSFGISSNVSTSAITQFSYALAPRNNFPEFRYGREEMLSLFDKNYNMPEILPTFKKIFVEKVQLPLALTPSTDEELLSQVPPAPTQRPSWMQRSPVGFSSSTRGTGRGGSVDRGRMRGKSNYHQIYQRPTALFGDDDSRSVPLKTDRGWSERNGGGDSLNMSSGNIGGIGLSSDWNGTPTSSPRKEFSNHPRNMENWRRNRNEDGSGDASTSGLGNAEAWRGSNSISGSFAATHRWGRSTSWRDDEISASPAADVGFSNNGGSGMTMQRSYSTITTVTERGSYAGSNSGGSTTKTPANPPYGTSANQASSRTFNALSGLNVPSTRSTQWNTNNSSIGGSSGAGGDGEDNLPEWAMENPSNGGGTFDASGAFHGSVDEDESENSSKQSRKKSDSSCESSTRYAGSCVRESKSSEASTGETTASLENDLNKEGRSESSEQSAACTPAENSIDLLKENDLEPLAVPSTNNDPKSVDAENTVTEELDSANLATSQSQQGSTPDTTSTEVVSKEAVTTSNTSYYNTTSNSVSTPSNTLTDSNSSVHRDLSDRMREVADDMIEKLIMDDDTINISDNVRNAIKSEASVHATAATPSTPIGNNICTPNVFTSVAVMLKQTPRQSMPTPAAVSPTLTSLPDGSVHKGIQLYGGGVVVDHAAMQHHHLQQQQLAAAVHLSSSGRLPHGLNSATSTATPTDLWYYRDPQSKVQGPFTAIEMTEWYRAGYFNENLYVRRLCDTHFRSLGELIKLCNDNMPFTHSHLIPNLDNMHLSNSAPGAVRQPQKPQLIGDFTLKQQTQNENRDQLKGTFGVAGADFLSGNVKNHIVPVDVSNMYFQMLRHQEMLIYNEMSENECFQHLTPSEKEAVVRQKLQMHSEYLSNLSGLSNSLVSINPPAATNHLYDVIIDGSKKDHLFGGAAASTGSQNVSQQTPPQPNPFLDPDDFLINSQQHQQPMQTVFSSSPFGNVLPPGRENGGPGKLGSVNDDQTGNELLNNFNMRMFLPSGEANSPLLSNTKPQDFIGGPNADFLNETQMLVARNPLGQNNSLVHSWLPPAPNQAPMASQLPPNEWSNNMLVGIPMTVVQGNNGATGNVNNLTQEIQQAPQQSQKTIPTSMWDLPTLEHVPSLQKSQQQTESNAAKNFDRQNSLSMQVVSGNEAQLSVSDGQNLLDKVSDTDVVKHADTTMQSQQQNLPTAVLPTTSTVTKQRKEEINDKYQNGNTKRIVNKQHLSSTKNAKASDEGVGSKRNEDDRRRDQADDKRRLKEEKKRQQADEEKRRQQQVDEEKRRQVLEEKERQQQIQAQRRKAMLGTNSNPNNSSSGLDGSVTSSSKSTKEQRVQSSIAPWSAQTNAAATKGGPCLAEIQKAERRERQIEQRQMELFVKRVRASAAAAAEAFDSMLKWNAPAKDVPVKNFAEIQAEEAKRLANEQLEMQRRKEQEQQQAATATAISASSSAGLGSNSISAIWSGTKVWGSTSTTGFWEEPIKFSAAVAANNNLSSNTAAAGNSAGCSNNNNKHTPTGQPKIPASIANTLVSSNSGQHENNQQISATRNLRKSQTVSVMQNAATPNGKTSKVNIQQHHANTAKPGPSNKALPPRAGGNNADSGAGVEKKGSNKNQQQNLSSGSSSASNNKRDDYENEFVAWCTKSLNNMNTKLDVPTFVSFLRDLESPYEVKDYIRMYLGENKESTDFGKQFLERRSRYKNLQRAQNAHNDDMCKPAPAITPSGNDNFDNKELSTAVWR